MSSLLDPIVLLSLIIFLPAAGALIICFLPKRQEELAKLLALFTTVAVFLLTVWIAIPAPPPAVTVTVEYPDADAQTVQAEVTDRVERAVQAVIDDLSDRVPGLKLLPAESDEGLSRVSMEVGREEDLDLVAQEVRARLAAVVSDLPSGVGPPIVDTLDRDARSARFALGTGEMQHVVAVPWIPAFNIHYMLGTDGISFPLVILTSFLSVLAMWASWPITKHVKAYCILFLLLETGMLGVFLALDFFLFYVFWEVMLLPMYFLIGVWGGPRREYAAIKFFLFTLVGSVLMLIALLLLYFTSDLNDLTDRLPETELAACHIQQDLDQVEYTRDNRRIAKHTFNMLALAKIGQLEDSPFAGKALLFGQSVGWWAFLLFFIGFVIKLPAVPVHTWLPDAHVEAPTPISMILAGVLLKMGGYGVLRVCYPMCPQAGFDLSWFVCGVGVLSMVYGAFAAMAQTDFKRLVAYSSVSHMGYVLLGIGVWTATREYHHMADYWAMGVNGAMFQMIAHGLSSAGMFFLVGVIYERVHHRDLNRFGGLFAKMPIYGGLSMGIFFAAMGLPGLCGFWGEVYVVLASWRFSMVLAIVAASVVILTAGYILWTLQRVYLGPEYKGPHGEAITRMTPREVAIGAPLLALAVLFGVYPQSLLDYMTPTIDRNLKAWTQHIEEPQPVESAAVAPSAPDQSRRLAGGGSGEVRSETSRAGAEPPDAAPRYAALSSGTPRISLEEHQQP